MNRAFELETELLALQSEKDQLVRQNQLLKDRIQDLETHILFDDARAQPSPTKPISKRSYNPSPRMIFYHAHKKDPFVLAEIRKIYGNNPVAWHCVKAITDIMYNAQPDAPTHPAQT